MSGPAPDDMAELERLLARARQPTLTHVLLMFSIGLVGGVVGWGLEQVAEDTLSAHGMSFAISVPDGVIPSTEPGRYIFSGSGSEVTPYILLSNTLSSELHRIGYSGYGFAFPGGSSFNLDAVSSDASDDEYARSFGLTQGDVAAARAAAGDSGRVTVLLDTGVPECAFVVGRYPDLAALVAAAADPLTPPVRVGMPDATSGSHATATAMLSLLGLAAPDVDVTDTFSGQGTLLDAYADGALDVAIFVQYPGPVEGRLRAGGARVVDERLPLVPVDTPSFAAHLAGAPLHYRLLEIPLGRRTHPMLCTDVLLVARDPDTITDPVQRSIVTKMHHKVRQEIGAAALQFPDAAALKVLAE